MIIGRFNRNHIEDFEKTIKMIFTHSEQVDFHLDKFITRCRSYLLRHRKKDHSVLEHNIEVAEALLKERRKAV